MRAEEASTDPPPRKPSVELRLRSQSSGVLGTHRHLTLIPAALALPPGRTALSRLRRLKQAESVTQSGKAHQALGCGQSRGLGKGGHSRWLGNRSSDSGKAPPSSLPMTSTSLSPSALGRKGRVGRPGQAPKQATDPHLLPRLQFPDASFIFPKHPRPRVVHPSQLMCPQPEEGEPAIPSTREPLPSPASLPTHLLSTYGLQASVNERRRACTCLLRKSLPPGPGLPPHSQQDAALGWCLGAAVSCCVIWACFLPSLGLSDPLCTLQIP